MAARSRTLVVGLFVFALAASACDLPSLREARETAQALPETSFIYSADGTLITSLHAGENRVVVRSRKIPDVVRNAVIAIEDQRFYDHSGVDMRALLRAAYIDATTGEVVEGGSTITQQLVKKLYVGDEQTVARKIREAYLAWKLEQNLSKDRILTRYLNTVYFGNGAYGIQAASETYFGIEPLELSLSQAATLAGLIAAPVDYDPVRHPGRSERRRNRVLTLMLGLQMIDQTEFDKASGSTIHLDLTPEDETHYVAPWFVDYVKEWFLSNPRFGETPQDRYDLLFEGGLKIVTTVDLRLQRAAERAIGSVLTEPGDPYGALTAIDPRTGYVRAMVGGRDYWNEDDDFARINLATGGVTGRQAGSAFKPFALVAALEHGIPRTQPLNGSTAHILLQDGTYWDPHNAEGGGYGTISLESATVNSVNVAYANLLSVIGDGDPYAGASALVEAAVRMGIRCCPRTTEPNGPLAAVPAAVLGVNEVSTLEMASAYGTLADLGRHVQPTPVISVTTSDGDVIYQAPSRAEQAVEPAIAAEAVDILQGRGAVGHRRRREHRAAAVRQDRHRPERERRVVRRRDPPDGDGRVGGVPAGADPDVLRERADLDGLRRDVAGLDLACVHARGDRGAAGEGVRDGTERRLRDAARRRDAGLPRQPVHATRGHRRAPVPRGRRADARGVHRAVLLPAAGRAVGDRLGAAGGDLGPAQRRVHGRDGGRIVGPAGRNGGLARSRWRLSADPDRDGDDHRGQGRARTLAGARPRRGAERDRHAARRRRGGDPAGGVRSRRCPSPRSATRTTPRATTSRARSGRSRRTAARSGSRARRSRSS